MALEEHFEISIPNSDSEIVFSAFTLAGAVHYLIDRIDARATSSEAEK